MHINCCSILWRTRGKFWDYTFLLSPVTPTRDSWYDVYTEIFSLLVPSEEPITRGGRLISASGSHIYLATTFKDNDRLDAVGRAVTHSIAYFLDNESVGDLNTIDVPAYWGRQFVAAFDAVYSKAFNLSDQEYRVLDNNYFKTLFMQSCSKMNEVTIDDETMVSVKFDICVDVSHIQSTKSGVPNSTTSSQDLTPSTNLSKQISDAVIEGEAYAIKFSGNFGTLKSIRYLMTSTEEEQLKSLADSFGGSVNDRFIKMRLNGIRERIAGKKLSNKPKRGFDAIIDALKTIKLGEHPEKMIAQLLDASENDIVVRNIISRLRNIKSI